MQVTLQSLQSK